MGTSFAGLSLGNFRLGVGAVEGVPGVFIGETFWCKVEEDYSDVYREWYRQQEIKRDNKQWELRVKQYNKQKKQYRNIIPLSAKDFDVVKIGDTIWGLPWIQDGPSWGEHIVLDKHRNEPENWVVLIEVPGRLINEGWFANAWFGRKP